MKFHLTVGNLDPVLQSYIDCRTRNSIIIGPLGSGKTYGSCQRLITQMMEQKPNRERVRKTRWGAIRNTFPDLQTTTIRDWLDLFGDLGRYKAGGAAPPSHTLRFKLPDRTIVESEIIFLALDRPDTIKKLRGTQFTGFWLNEIKELAKAIVDMADLRHGRYPSPIDGGPSWHGMIGDTNAPDDDHWLYDLAEITHPLDWSFFIQPGGLMREMVEEDDTQIWTGNWIENPLAENVRNLPEGYYTKGKEGKSHDWIAVNLANEYGSVQTGKPVYKEQWSDTLHVSETIQLIDKHPIWIGLDFGLTPAAVIGQETPRGNLHILEELVAEDMGIEQFAESLLLPLLRQKYRRCEWNFVGDPSGNKRADTDEETVFKLLAKEEIGIDVEPANTNDSSVRLEAVRYFLTGLRDGKPAFRLHPQCKVLRKGFNGGYELVRLKVTGQEKFKSKPDKNKFSHPHDALQYLCMAIRGDIGEEEEEFESSVSGRWSN